MDQHLIQVLVLAKFLPQLPLNLFILHLTQPMGFYLVFFLVRLACLTSALAHIADLLELACLGLGSHSGLQVINGLILS